MSFIGKIKQKTNSLVRRSYWYNNVVFPDCKKFWSHSVFNLDVINLGSTSGKYAFNYSDSGLRAANWAMSPQSFFVDFEILQNYFSYLKPEAYILLSICPFSCMVGYDVYIRDWYYTVLRHSSIPHFSVKRKNEIMNLKNNPINYYPLVELKRDLLRILNIHSSCMDKNKLENDANVRTRNWMKEFSILDFNHKLSIKNQDSYNEAVEIFSNIILFSQEKGFKPVIVLPPVNKYLSDKFTPEMQELFINSFVEKVISNSNKIPFLNYFVDKMGNDISLFQNSFFLNEKGAKLFTKRVLQDLSTY